MGLNVGGNLAAGGGGGGGAVTVADGADVAQGAVADVAVTSDAAGTLSAKLRGLVAILADVWDNANNLLRVRLTANSGVDIGDVDVTSLPAGNIGQQAMAASLSTVPANNITDATYIGDIKFGEALPAGTNLIGKTQPFDAIIEGGLTELVGINEEVNTNDYSGSIGVALAGTYSGEILSFAFYATEDGTGAIQDSAGKLIILDADPAVSSGDTALAAAEFVTILGMVDVDAADWHTDANGGVAYITDQPVPFHSLGTLYFVWFHEDATDLNDGAGDDEQLEFNFWYRRDS